MGQPASAPVPGNLPLSKRFDHFHFSPVPENSMIAELNGLSSNAVVRTYVWGLDLSGSLRGAGGVGGLLTVSNGTATYAPAYDGNGNVVSLIKAADGSDAADFEYDPFGNVLKSTGVAANAQPFGFSTKYQDTETGLLNFGHRFYAPGPGRFLNHDPSGEFGGINLYGFVNNAPISLIDTDGRSIQDIWQKTESLAADGWLRTKGAADDAGFF
jgi:RHS repeat-associated protein